MKEAPRLKVFIILLSLSITAIAEKHVMPIYHFSDSTVIDRLQSWVETYSDSTGVEDLSLIIRCFGYRPNSEKLFFTCTMVQRANLPYIFSKRDSVGSGIALLDKDRVAYLSEAALWKDVVKYSGKDTLLSFNKTQTVPLSSSYFSLDYLPNCAKIFTDSREVHDTKGQLVLSRREDNKLLYHVDDKHSKEIALYGPVRDSFSMYLDSYLDSLLHIGEIHLVSSRRPWSVDVDVFSIYLDKDQKITDVRVLGCDTNRKDNGEGTQMIAEQISKLQDLEIPTIAQYPCVYLYVYRRVF